MKKFLILLIALSPFILKAQVFNRDRYPYRFPDWLRKSEMINPFFTAKTQKSLDTLIDLMQIASKNNMPNADSLWEEITTRINKNLSLLDAEKGAVIVGNKNKIALHLDPNFDPNFQKILLRAANIFCDIALDKKVIKEAFDSSSYDLYPLPEMYDSTKGFTSKYLDFLECRKKPFSKAQFATQLSNVFNTLTGDPVLLIISSYQEEIWWGYSYYNYYYYTVNHLSKFSPTSGYLYFGFNTQKYPTYNDTAFWASKIAHELLHNLGYWHPVYKNAEDRDKNNIGKQQAFIVAYERAILRRAKEYIRNTIAEKNR